MSTLIEHLNKQSKEVLSKLLEKNCEVSTKACDSIQRSNGYLKKTLLKTSEK